MTIVYNLAFAVFAILYLPYLFLRGRFHKKFFMRFGIFSTVLCETVSQKENIWIHAVSLGEVQAVSQFVKQLKERFPLKGIVVSTVTKTGYLTAEKVMPSDTVIVYAPLDFSVCVRRYLRLIRPKIYIAVETEIWPNLFAALHAAGIPIVQINGRISPKAFKRYRLIRFLLKNILGHVRQFCMRSEEDARMIIALGAPEKKVRAIGNIKFDSIPPEAKTALGDFGFSKKEILLVAGSTHRGEEEILFSISKVLAEEFTDFRLVVAPRHVDRASEIGKLAERCGLKPFLFSQMASKTLGLGSVVIVDTFGQLKNLYGLADMVFIGKSLTAHGGHNIIEPAYFSKPIIVGPYMENFQDIADIFLKEKAIAQIKDKAELASKIKEFLQNPDERRRLGLLARKVVDRHKGATAKTVDTVSEILQSPV